MRGCAYRDRNGDGCDTRWCMVHVAVVDGVGYCPRHAGAMRAIRASSSPEERPPVACRAPSLTNWMADSLGHEIGEMVAGFGVAVRAYGLQHHLDGRHHRWERAWSLEGPGGRLSIFVDVFEQTDIVVRVRLGDKTLLRTVPPWIEQHRNGVSGGEETRLRQQFCQRIVFMIAQALEVGQRTAASSLTTAAPTQQPL